MSAPGGVIEFVAETPDTVTLRRADFEALAEAAEGALVAAALARHRAHEDRVGWEAAKAGYYTGAEAAALLDGASPVKIWRTKRGLTQRALAEMAGVGASYLAEIEAGRKPGSVEAIRRLARALDMPMEHLVPVATAD